MPGLDPRELRGLELRPADAANTCLSGGGGGAGELPEITNLGFRALGLGVFFLQPLGLLMSAASDTGFRV